MFSVNSSGSTSGPALALNAHTHTHTRPPYMQIYCSRHLTGRIFAILFLIRISQFPKMLSIFGLNTSTGVNQLEGSVLWDLSGIWHRWLPWLVSCMNLRQRSNRFAFGWLKWWLLYRYLPCEQQAPVIRRSLVDVGRIVEDNRINRLYLENGLWRDVLL